MSRSVSSVPTQADRLRDALSDTGISRRELARQMRLLRGEKPKETEIGYTKSQLTTWVRGTHGISDDNAELISKALNKLTKSLRFDLDYFKNPDLARSKQDLARELAELRERLGRGA